MQISFAISLLTTAIAGAAAAVIPSSNVTYSVVSFVPNNETVSVLVDGELYPLTSMNEVSTLLHTGEAPIANTGYKYAIVNKSNNSVIIDEESFTRIPISANTFNEYYGRSWNTKPLVKLPVVMNPLPVINRIESDLHIDGQIPTIHITGNQTAVDYIHSNPLQDTDIVLNMTYISPNDVKTFEGITFSISGHSTRMSTKLSYKIKIPKEGDDLYNYRRLKLRAMSTDSSYMREELAYKIAESVGLPTTRYSFARLYINDQPIGLFGLTEAFKNPWIRNEFADGDKHYKQGTFFVADLSGGKSVVPTGDETMPGNATDSKGKKGQMPFMMNSKSDLSSIGTNLTVYSQYYSLKEKPSEGLPDYSKIMDLTNFIAEQSNSTIVNNTVVPLWQKRLDTDSVLRSLALEIVLSDSDAYTTMANNYILYDDPESKRLVMSEQDFDLSMGTTMFNTTQMYGGNWTDFPGVLTRPLTQSMLRVPQFRNEFENLILNYTKGIMNPTVLFPRIDELYKMLEDDVAWDRSLPRVGNNSAILQKIEDMIGSGNITTSSAADVFDSSVTFYDAVNGNTNNSMSMGLKEWISLRSTNIMTFFNNTF
ncbi:MAG: coth protein-domain-containing protein [Benjaminiella poitrasii]|nr:MAG: coth protein-domain-containing protein [Benjaminiella poitrasii]